MRGIGRLAPGGARFGAVAFAGSGGAQNLCQSNWIRDKGFGMGSLVGAMPSAVGGHAIQLSHVGTVFPTTEANLRRWMAGNQTVNLSGLEASTTYYFTIEARDQAGNAATTSVQSFITLQ